MTLSIFELEARHPEETGLIDNGESYSYARLAELAREQLAMLSPNTRRSVVASSDVSTIARVLGLLAREEPLVLLHPRLSAHEHAELLASIADDELPAGCLAVLFTSGTRGRPKGVQLSRRAFLASARASRACLGWAPTDRWLLSLPLGHVGGLSVLTRCLLAQKPVVLPEPGSGLDVARLTRAVDTQRVTLLSVVPTQLERLLRAAWTPPPHLRAVLLGGAAAPAPLVAQARAAGWPLLLTYGLTEACSQVATQRPGETASGAPPLPGVELRISQGRIEIRGDMLLDRYLPSRLHQTPLSADGWFRTSDIGELTAEGRLLVHGRADDVLITGGENVHPGEIEPVLEALPGVQEAIVFGVPDAQWGQLIAAALLGSRELNLEELRPLLHARLAPHRRPRQLAVLDRFAETPGGKRDRQATIRRARAQLMPL